MILLMAIRVMQAILSVGCTKRARRTGHGAIVTEDTELPETGGGGALVRGELCSDVVTTEAHVVHVEHESSTN